MMGATDNVLAEDLTGDKIVAPQQAAFGILPFADFVAIINFETCGLGLSRWLQSFCSVINSARPRDESPVSLCLLLVVKNQILMYFRRIRLAA